MRRLIGALVICSFTSFLFAGTPLRIEPIPDKTLSVGGSMTVAIDDYIGFYLPEAPRVQVVTNLGTIPLELTPDRAPKTVENFLNYVFDGDYTDTLFHRSAPGFVIQTGGFALIQSEEQNSIDPIATDEPVVNEFNVSNTLGTIAMAKLGNDPDSATSQWFINLQNNGSTLDGQNGGFTVFGSVTGDGMDVANAIAALPRFNFSSFFNLPLNELPLQNYDESVGLTIPNLIIVSDVSVIPEDPAQVDAAELTDIEIVSNSAPNFVAATIDGRNLILTASAESTGSTEIKIRVTGDGQTIESTFTVTTSGAGITTVFPGSAEAGNDWWFSSWLDFFYAGSWPWVYHPAHEWLYLAASESESFWAFDDAIELGWMWTSDELYPSFFHATSGEFITYDNTNTAQRWFFFPSSGWQRID
ncbi:peptidylprolyl isomerase [Rubellicoccus peritrichatus]|uniref:peptidylprolyl isomerase n=1 Tax=Rubellicoccus peritrichatus TaxID=3080537 RepID=A0AAQ3QVH0_9BACT|nr:peptidylprolyl isomerase [Puniceicoccus sp. CR14]WOO41598.1 peptidylprolyl isomerase [Puniceicoccus sp. CR14]